MSKENDDLESEYDDVLFELCDVRTTYPAKCANELKQCLRLTSEINLKPIKPTIKEKVKPIVIPEEEMMLYNEIRPTTSREISKKIKERDKKITELLKQARELKTILDQINNKDNKILS